jgi:hypothetical protein
MTQETSISATSVGMTTEWSNLPTKHQKIKNEESANGKSHIFL